MYCHHSPRFCCLLSKNHWTMTLAESEQISIQKTRAKWYSKLQITVPHPLKMNKDELYYIIPPDNFSKPKKFWFMIFWTSTFRASHSFTFITYWNNTKFSVKSSIYPSAVLYSTSTYLWAVPVWCVSLYIQQTW